MSGRAALAAFAPFSSKMGLGCAAAAPCHNKTTAQICIPTRDFAISPKKSGIIGEAVRRASVENRNREKERGNEAMLKVAAAGCGNIARMMQAVRDENVLEG